MQLPETLETFLASIGAHADLERLEEVDRRSCNCPIPYTLRKYYPVLGTWTNIRLCCFVQAMEKFMDVEPGTFYQVFDFEPTWEWDCREIVPETGKPRGRPPAWLEKRMNAKGITIKE